MRRLMSMAAALALAASAGASGSATAAPALNALGTLAHEDGSPPIERVQYYWGGQNYCWYPNGWKGPGWYWCGYASRYGNGWGGGYGWRGWGVPGGWHGGYGYYGRPGWHGGGVYGGGVYRGGGWHGGGWHGGGGGWHGGGWHGGGYDGGGYHGRRRLPPAVGWSKGRTGFFRASPRPVEGVGDAADEIGLEQQMRRRLALQRAQMGSRRGDLAFERPQRRARLTNANGREPAAISRTHLGEASDIGPNDVADFRIAARRLAIGHQNQGRPVARDLNGAEGGSVRNDIVAARMVDRWAEKAIGHAVGRRRQSEVFAEEGFEPGGREVVVLRAEDNANGHR
jgi:hypothetical protein